jgi:BMFP domain-containing protein YqiC
MLENRMRRPYIFFRRNQSETGALSVTGKNKPLDDLSNLMTNAVGAIKGVGDEVKAMGRSQAEKFVQDMDLVSREEFDVLKARLDAALAEIDALKAAKKPARKTAAKKKD